MMINCIVTNEDFRFFSQELDAAELTDNEKVIIALGEMDQCFLAHYVMETTGRELLDFVTVLKLEDHSGEHLSKLMAERFADADEALVELNEAFGYDEDEADMIWSLVEIVVYREDDYKNNRLGIAGYS